MNINMIKMNYIKTFEGFNNNGLLKINSKSELFKILKPNTFRLFNEEIKKDDSRLDFDKYNYFGLFDNDKCVALLSYTENHWSLNSNNYKDWVYLDTLESIKQGSCELIPPFRVELVHNVHKSKNFINKINEKNSIIIIICLVNVTKNAIPK